MQLWLHAGNPVPVPGPDDTGHPQSPGVGGDPNRKVLRRKSRSITGSQRIVSASMSPVWVPCVGPLCCLQKQSTQHWAHFYICAHMFGHMHTTPYKTVDVHINAEGCQSPTGTVCQPIERCPAYASGSGHARPVLAEKPTWKYQACCMMHVLG